MKKLKYHILFILVWAVTLSYLFFFQFVVFEGKPDWIRNVVGALFAIMMYVIASMIWKKIKSKEI